MNYKWDGKPVPTRSLPSKKMFVLMPRPTSSLSHAMCRPAIHLGQVLGFLPWNLNAYSLPICNQAISLLYKASVAAGTIYIFTEHMKPFAAKKYPSKISKLVSIINLYVQILFLSFTHVYCFVKEKRFHKLLKLLGETDSLLKRRNRKRSFMFYHCALQYLLTLVTWICLVIRITHYSSHYAAAIYSVAVFTFLFTELFVSMFFIISANLCAENFTSLNSELHEVLHSNISVLKKCLYQFRVRYEQLYQLSATVEYTFKWLITLDLGLLTAFLCFFSYTVLKMTHFELKDAPHLLYLILFSFRLFTITKAADNISVKAKLGLESLHNIPREDLTSREEFQVIMLTNKLSQSAVEITSAGRLFTLNTNTFTTIMATILTYLIVLMQFQHPEDSPSGVGTQVNNSNSTVTE